MQEPGVRTRSHHAHDVAVVLVVVAASLAGPVVGAIAVLLWAQFSRTPMRAFGFKVPLNWLIVLAFSATLGFALRIILKSLVMPLFGAPAVNAHYQHLAGNTAALPGVVAGLLLAGAAEELLYRGFVFERLRTLLGAGLWVLNASIVVSAGTFALAHYNDQGYLGVIQSAITGLVFAAMFAWQRHIWTPIIAHVTFNLTGVALIYSGLEDTVARSIFR